VRNGGKNCVNCQVNNETTSGTNNNNNNDNNTGEATETSYLFPRISVLMQRFNAVLLRASLPATDCMD